MRLRAFITLLMALSMPLQASAKGWCYDNAGIPVDEAYKKADLIFYGTMEEMYPVKFGVGDRSTFNLGNGISGGQIDCVPNEEKPYNPEHDCGLTYRSEFRVFQVLKDIDHRVQDKKVSINVLNAGYSGYQFKFREYYLVYAWNATDDPNDLPWAGLCTRTRPDIYATDDLRYMRDIKGIKLHSGLETIILRSSKK